MKKTAKIITLVFVIVAIAAMSLGLVACNDNDYTARYEGQVIRFAAPEGTPALAMLRLVTDNPTLDGTEMEYAVVNAGLIQAEMRNKADVVIMPINAGAKLINQGMDYKLVSVAVEGSLFLIGKKDGGNTLTFEDIKGKKIACIGQNNVPGLTFEYVVKSNGLEVIYSGEPNGNQVLIDYAKDGSDARTKYKNNSVQYLVVGEPAATQFKSVLQLNAEMDIQRQYAIVSADANSYPQAGLFVRSALAKDKKFMNALFEALGNSRKWVEANAGEVSAFATEHLYEAVFPAASIPRCAIKCERLDDKSRGEIIEFLKIIAPTDSEGKTINWDNVKNKLF